MNNSNQLPVTGNQQPLTVREIKAQSKHNMIRKLFALGYHRNFQSLWHADERTLSASQRVAKHLNEWFITHKESPVKKPFGEMTLRELQTAVTVFDKIEHWHLAQINKTPL